jgi:transketolase
LDRTTFSSASGLFRGAYILHDTKDGRPDIILIATGSEVAIALEAYEKLEEKGVKTRVVSMPSWELFDKQPEDYQCQVLPPEIKPRIAIEAGITQGWHRYVGNTGEVMGLDRFGASAPYKILYEKFGLTVDRVVGKALALFSTHNK